VPRVTDSQPTQPTDAGAGIADDQAASAAADAAKPAFTKEPQPDLPLELRKEKAGWNKNRFAIWFAVGAFAIFMIVEGIVGILTKAR
jgi:hypothetical protein